MASGGDPVSEYDEARDRFQAGCERAFREREDPGWDQSQDGRFRAVSELAAKLIREMLLSLPPKTPAVNLEDLGHRVTKVLLSVN